MRNNSKILGALALTVFLAACATAAAEPTLLPPADFDTFAADAEAILETLTIVE